jgi:transglutaminase-like putative cysteine protease
MRASIWVCVITCLSAAVCQRMSTPALAEELVEETVVADESSTNDAANVNEPSLTSTPTSVRPQPLVPGSTEKSTASAKNRYAVIDPALELADPRTYRLKVVIRIEAPDGAVKNVIATGPIPMDWPEQRVRLISEKLSPQCKVSEQILKGQAALIRFQVPQIPKGGSAFVERLYEITRYRTKFSLAGEELKMPHGVPSELKDQVAGAAPGMETKSPQMIELASALRKASQDDGPWETIKTFWGWTRDNVKFENGDFRGALYAIENRCGDCEEMSALFVGLCRLSGIPARSVWVEGHDYPEFYLLDKQGKGHWIPAQVVGPPWFGEITEYRPIFQKGDRFYDALTKTYVRYVPHTVKGSDGKALPKVEYRHEIIADSDINGPSYNNPK